MTVAIPFPLSPVVSWNLQESFRTFGTLQALGRGSERNLNLKTLQGGCRVLILGLFGFANMLSVA